MPGNAAKWKKHVFFTLTRDKQLFRPFFHVFSFSFYFSNLFTIFKPPPQAVKGYTRSNLQLIICIIKYLYLYVYSYIFKEILLNLIKCICKWIQRIYNCMRAKNPCSFIINLIRINYTCVNIKHERVNFCLQKNIKWFAYTFY